MTRRESSLDHNAPSRDEQVGLGAFYTPPEIVAFLCEWAIRSPSDRILEPAAGNGNFVDGAISRLAGLGAESPARQISAVEIRASAAHSIDDAFPGVDVRPRDFFEMGPDALPKMNVVIGNPPFLRFHRFIGRPRDLGRARATALDVELSGLASSWAHFLVHACAFLEPVNGRLGLVLPAELLHADYAQSIRDFLVRRFVSVTIVAFDRRAFHPTLVDAVLLLCDPTGPRGLRIWRLTDASQLSTTNILGSAPTISQHGRWSGALHQDAARLYGRLVEQDRYVRLGSIASVDIGVVTGANAFFILTEQQRQGLGLSVSALTPIVERGRDLRGLQVRASETQWLLSPDDESEWAVAAYLAEGVKRGVPLGYKTSRRKRWWNVPTPRLRPDLLIGYMHSSSPRLVTNPDRFWSSNLIHGARLIEPIDARAVAAASLSAATAFSAEIEGRVYGGGVLKLETRETERLLIPRLSDSEVARLVIEFDAIDRLLRDGRRGDASRTVDEILDIDHDEATVGAAAFQERRRALRTRASSGAPR